jgi:hypothetical protein
MVVPMGVDCGLDEKRDENLKIVVKKVPSLAGLITHTQEQEHRHQHSTCTVHKHDFCIPAA